MGFSIIIIAAALMIYFSKKDIKYVFLFMTAMFLIVFLVFYKMNFSFVVYGLTVQSWVEIILAIVLVIYLLLTFKRLKTTQLSNDMEELSNKVIPYEEQKLLFLFFIIQTLPTGNIFLMIVFAYFISSWFKFEGYKYVLTTLIAITVSQITFVSNKFVIESFNNGLNIEELSKDTVMYTLFITFLAIIVIKLIVMLYHRTIDDPEYKKVGVQKNIFILLFYLVSYLFIFIIASYYFSIYNSHVFASSGLIIILLLSSKFIYPKIELGVSTDEFFDQNFKDKPIIVSYLASLIFYLLMIGGSVNIIVTYTSLIIFAFIINIVYKKQIKYSVYNNFICYLSVTFVLLSTVVFNGFILQSHFNLANFGANINQQFVTSMEQNMSTISVLFRTIANSVFANTSLYDYVVNSNLTLSYQYMVLNNMAIFTSVSVFVLYFTNLVFNIENKYYNEVIAVFAGFIGFSIVGQTLIQIF